MQKLESIPDRIQTQRLQPSTPPTERLLASESANQFFHDMCKDQLFDPKLQWNTSEDFPGVVILATNFKGNVEHVSGVWQSERTKLGRGRISS